jgi:hypothetical protein
MPFLALCGVENLFRNTCFECMITPSKVNCCPKYINVIVADGTELNEKTFHDLLNQVDIQAEDSKKPTKVISLSPDNGDFDRYRGEFQKGIIDFSKKCLALLSPNESDIEDASLRKKEALEKFKFACNNTMISYDELKRRHANGFLTENEQKKIFKQVENLQKNASKACEIWQKFAYLEITTLSSLTLLKKTKKITDEEFSLFKPLVGRNYRNILTFNELDDWDKQVFLKIALKVKNAAHPKYFSWLSQRDQLPQVKALTLESTLMQSSAIETKSDIYSSAPPPYQSDSGAGAFGSTETTRIERALSDVALAPMDSFDDQHQKAFEFIKKITDGKLSENDLKIGNKKLEFLCKILNLDINEIRLKGTQALNKKQLKELEKNITVIQNISASIFYVFFQIKKIEKLNDEKKIPELKKNLGEDAYNYYYSATKGKRAAFNTKVFTTKELIELDLDVITILFNIAIKFSEAEMEQHRNKYPVQHWIDGIRILNKDR